MSVIVDGKCTMTSINGYCKFTLQNVLTLGNVVKAMILIRVITMGIMIIYDNDGDDDDDDDDDDDGDLR